MPKSEVRSHRETASKIYPWQAQLIPVATTVLQLVCWQFVKPFSFLLFYPAIFVTSRVAGLTGGITSSFFSALLVLYFFVEPRFSWTVYDPKIYVATSIYVLTGIAFSFFHQRLRQTEAARRRAFAVSNDAVDHLEARVAERTDELTRANRALLESEERINLVVSGAKDYAIFMLDPAGLVMTWTAGIQRLKGYAAEEIVGQHFSKFYSAEDLAAGLPRRELETALAEGSYEGEGWRYRKDGSRFFGSVVITAIHREGKLVGFSKVTRDITERRRIEQSVKENEARLVAVIGSAMDAVIIVDAAQRISLFNPAAEKMFCYKEADVVGQSLEKLMPPRFRNAHAGHIRKFAATNDTRRAMGALTPIYGLRADGTEFPIDASISQVEVDGERIFSVILRDITERTRADEELRQQASLLDLAPVLVRDMQDRIVFWSSSLASLYGFSPEEAAGRVSHELLETTFPVPIAQVLLAFHKDGRWEGELSHRDRTGSRVIVNSLWVLYRDTAGNPSRILEFNADITARKRDQALQQRSQKLESLGTLSGGIAHDFNNILLAITGNAKLATSDLPPDHPVQQSLMEITRAGARATDLVRRILTFSRPAEIKRQLVNLQPISEEALKLVRATLPATISLRPAFSDHLPGVLADATQIHQILVNLVTNAAHAIGSRSDGVIDIRLDASKLTGDDIAPTLNLPPGDYVRLLVSDNGSGMERATLDRIFDPFFTTKAPGEGTGLGLSVVHGIVKNHDGGITVYSEPGRGTTFRLFFPAAGVPAPLALAESLTESARKRTEHVLYVDDEESLVALVTRTLQRIGYKITGRTSPVLALELFRANPAQFDAVVTDLAMPQLSGFDLCSQLLAIRPDLPVVMTSGYVRAEDQERALAMGLRDLILKPDTIEQLGRTLDHIFQQDPSRRPSSTNTPISS